MKLFGYHKFRCLAEKVQRNRLRESRAAAHTFIAPDLYAHFEHVNSKHPLHESTRTWHWTVRLGQETRFP